MDLSTTATEIQPERLSQEQLRRQVAQYHEAMQAFCGAIAKSAYAHSAPSYVIHPDGRLDVVRNADQEAEVEKMVSEYSRQVIRSLGLEAYMKIAANPTAN